MYTDFKTQRYYTFNRPQYNVNMILRGPGVRDETHSISVVCLYETFYLSPKPGEGKLGQTPSKLHADSRGGIKIPE